jgi:hypothetical protein
MFNSIWNWIRNHLIPTAIISVLAITIISFLAGISVRSCSASGPGDPNIFQGKQRTHRPPVIKDRPHATDRIPADRTQKVRHGRDYSLKFVPERSYPADGPCERLEIQGNVAAGKDRALSDCRKYFGGDCQFEPDVRLTGILHSKGLKGEVFRTIPPGGCAPK